MTVNSSHTGMQGDYAHFLGCPELRSMAWFDRRSLYHQTPTLADDIQDGQWPFLDSLCLGIKSLSDRDIANIVLALGDRPMKLLELNDKTFGPLSASALLYGEIIDGENSTKSVPAEIP